jgi:hypothetical protein
MPNKLTLRDVRVFLARAAEAGDGEAPELLAVVDEAIKEQTRLEWTLRAIKADPHDARDMASAAVGIQPHPKLQVIDALRALDWPLSAPTRARLENIPVAMGVPAGEAVGPNHVAHSRIWGRLNDTMRAELNLLASSAVVA